MLAFRSRQHKEVPDVPASLAAAAACHCRRLRLLALSGGARPTERVQLPRAAALSNLTALRTLSLRYCRSGIADAPQLTVCTALESLEVKWHSCDGRLDALHAPAALRRLHLSGALWQRMRLPPQLTKLVAGAGQHPQPQPFFGSYLA